ncbi:alkaline phosphatase [Paenarthrobacter sp. A20]|uniref:alkaline phosphatase D family protein n=1 Tax=Paenarthrobacter sp. A20 TaxID=2817891 RepID=UPI00209FBC3D|nr:alkaline phosphatase D family protein [Paenarthrobacter sp. A20]MCP1413799.1 phosphodiesterase/alkaline phosphatase D-like protein [Paenarthrobacter sp. A20]
MTTHKSVGRRGFLGGGLASAGLTIAATVPASIPAHAAGGAPIRAAVLEFNDPWTKATGLGELLRRAGANVITLDPGLPATSQGVDLIAFGTFTNNAPTYLDYVAAQSSSLRDFAAAGGVVLDMAQSDQYSQKASYLPAPLSATRADPDHDAIYAMAPEHPLVTALRTGIDGRVLTDRASAIRVSWETLVDWESMRVLLSCAPGGNPKPPALLEGAHGKGRFLVTSLTIDKCFNAAGTAIQPATAVGDSEAFFAALTKYVSSVKAGTAPAVVPTPKPKEPAAGPMVGHTTDRTTRIWLRPGRDHHAIPRWECTVRNQKGKEERVQATLTSANDYSLIFEVDKLHPGTRYTFTIVPVTGDPEFTPLIGAFTTAPSDNSKAKVVMGVGSCAPSGSDAVWDRILAEGCDSFVFMGDTPYIDSVDLQFARQRHREFLQVPELARLVRSIPTWGTWDDHDFAFNASLGDVKGKVNTRTAFVDYRANASYGHTAAGEQQTRRDAGEGVYTSFRRGPVEVFLLDPRWFSRTEASWADVGQPTCLGTTQWQWFQKALRSSDATFKLVVSGMIWDDKQNAESDDWGTFPHEREAMFDFIKDEEIPGVVLLSGDIHVSRALNYGPRVGYDLWQWIVSPLHDRTIASLNVPHPALVHSAVEPNVFARIEADTTVKPATLKATWINRAGERIFEVATTSTQLGHRH